MKALVAKAPWYKEPWPWILMAGPGVVIVAGVITVWLAVKSNDGLVADDYYKQGLAINQQMQRDKGAERVGVQAEVMRSEQNLRLLLQTREGGVLPPTLTMKFTHPTRAGLDQIIPLVAEGQGLYAGRLASEISGRWHVALEEPSGQWRLVADWKLEQPGPLKLMASEGSSIDHSVTGR